MIVIEMNKIEMLYPDHDPPERDPQRAPATAQQNRPHTSRGTIGVDT